MNEMMTGIDPMTAYTRGMTDLADRLPDALHEYECHLGHGECPGLAVHEVKATAIVRLSLSLPPSTTEPLEGWG